MWCSKKYISVQNFCHNYFDPLGFYMSAIDCRKKHRLRLTRLTIWRACGVSYSCNMWPRIFLAEQTYQSATFTSTKSSVTLDIIWHVYSSTQTGRKQRKLTQDENNSRWFNDSGWLRMAFHLSAQRFCAKLFPLFGASTGTNQQWWWEWL